MPTLAHVQLPLPTSSDEFENIVMSAILGLDRNVHPQRYGSSGQGQQGVDIYFEDSTLRWIGVQCKLVKKFTIADVKKELAEAEAFTPTLDLYIFALGLKRDALLQKQIFTLCSERVARAQFRIAAWFWEDITFFLSRNATELSRHYPELFPATGTPTPVVAHPQTDLLRRRLAAYEEIWAFKQACLPPRRYPDMDWEEALEDIALSLHRHSKVLEDLIRRVGAILPRPVLEQLQNAHLAAEDGMFELQSADDVVPRRATAAADTMWWALDAAVGHFQEELGGDGVRFA